MRSVSTYTSSPPLLAMNRLKVFHHPLPAALAVAVLVTLSGCGKKEAGAGQIAAKVNKSEISVHQINYVLQRQPNLKPEQAPAASKRILEGLIDQELAIQAADDQKLDRSPQVVMAIEAAKREIIARAYLEKLGGAAAKPNEDEITRFFNEKPALFSQRKIYSLREVNVDAPGNSSKDLIAKARGLRAEDLISTLKASNVRHATRQVNQPAENLPLDLLDKLVSTPEGGTVVTTNPRGFSIIYVLAAKPAPVTEQQAHNAIEAFITNDRKRKLIGQGMKALRDTAKISYQGQFAGGPGVAASDPSLPITTTDAASGVLDDKALQKGLQGLK